jgi:hypothetical protein
MKTHATRTRSAETNPIGKRLAAGLAAVVLFGLPVVPAESHHSFAMYDQSIERTFTGKLVRFIIGANHSQFIFNVVDEGGNVVTGDDGNLLQWGVETGPASTLARQGITVESFPIDTIFTTTLNPLRDGRNFGAMRGGIIMCGVTMPAGGCTAETGESYGN